MLLSDGLSAISVFTAHRKPRAQAFQGFSQSGALNAYGRVVGSVHITVVGEAPSDTVRLIGENVQPAPSVSASGAGASDPRSAARRVGNRCVSTRRPRGAPVQ